MTPPTIIDYSNGTFTVDLMDQSIGAFTSVRGLEMQVDFIEYREGGMNNVVHRLPGQMRYPNLVFSQGVTAKGALEKWVMGEGIQPKLKTVIVTLLDTDSTEVRTWKFADGYPVRWTGPVLDAGGTMIAGEELEIAHGGFLS